MALSANLTADIRPTLKRPEQFAFVVKSSAVLYHNALAGLYLSGSAAGQVAPYDDADKDMVFIGVHVGDKITGDGTATTTIRTAGVVIDRAVVAGSGSAKAGAPFFALSDDIRDCSLVGAGGEIVGHLLEQQSASSTTWSVVLVDALAQLQSFSLDRKVGPANASPLTADGAITLPSKNFARQVLTGASSAQMTLAVPGSTTPIGYVFEIVRSGGSGTHDVDYTDDVGNAATAVLELGERIVLQAASAAGWRRLV